MFLRFLCILKIMRMTRELKLLRMGVAQPFRLIAWSVLPLALLIFALAISFTREIRVYWETEDSG